MPTNKCDKTNLRISTRYEQFWACLHNIKAQNMLLLRYIFVLK